MQQSQVSRLVAALESQLGVQLLRRTTRSVTVTEEGERFRLRLTSILHALDECESDLRGRRTEPSGLIRVACPTTLGRVVIAPIVWEFLELHARVRVELLMSNSIVNLMSDGIDVAVRVGRLPMNDLPVRNMGTVEQLLVASPRYLGERVVAEPSQLDGHNCFCFATSGGVQTWAFANGNEEQAVDVQGDFIANDAEVLMERCVAGLGITLLPRWLAGAALADGRLVQVMPEWTAQPMPLSIVCAHRSYRPRRIAVFLSFLETHLSPQLKPRAAG